MAPVQNTFSIVPNFPSANNRDDGDPTARPSRPAMTTKQAKKAYQKANRGPKLSKAEIRRQELLEQDRIRKEAEKERNQARARLARDRKREKEDNDRAEKKKKGLPLVNVRPSQDTIARFVRGFGAPKKANETSTTTTPAQSPPCSPPESPTNSPTKPPLQSSHSEFATAPAPNVNEPILAVSSLQAHSQDRLPAQAPALPTVPRASSRTSTPVGSPALIGVKAIPVSACSQIRSAGKHSAQDVDRPSPKRQRLSPSTEPIKSPESKLGECARPLLESRNSAAPGPCPSRTSPKAIGDAVGIELSIPALSDVMPMTLSQELEDMAEILTAEYLDGSFGSIFASPQAKPVSSERALSVANVLSTNPLESTRVASSKPNASMVHAGATGPARVLKQVVTNVKQPPASTSVRDSKANRNTMPRTPSQCVDKMAVNNRPLFDIPQAPAPILCAEPSQTHYEMEARRRNSRDDRTLMAPPPIPPKLLGRQDPRASSGLPLSHSDTSRGTSNYIAKPLKPKVSTAKIIAPPPSTQAFVLDHFEDLFPSPSQELNEVYSEMATGKTACSVSKSDRLQAVKRFQPPKATQPSSNKSLPSPRPPLRGMSANSSRSLNSNTVRTAPARSPAPVPPVTKVSADFEFPFLSTQDVSLSFEDIEELETPVCSAASRSKENIRPVRDNNKMSMPALPHAAHLPSLSQKHKGTTGQPFEQGLSGSVASKAESRGVLDLSHASGLTDKSNRVATQRASGKRETVRGTNIQGQAAISRLVDTRSTQQAKPPQAVQSQVATHARGIKGSVMSHGIDNAARKPITAEVARTASREPFFTSSCKQPLYKYAIERNKTSAWTLNDSNRKSESALDFLQQLENERFVSLLEEPDSFIESDDDLADLDQARPDRQPDSVLRKEAEQNQVFSGLSTTEPLDAQENDPQTSLRSVTKREPRTFQKPARLLSSYEKMLVELDKTNKENMNPSRPKDDGVQPSGSQETDYGDLGWDDEMLAFEIDS